MAKLLMIGGEIAGSGLLPNGDFHAIVLIPCDAEHGESEGCRDGGQNVSMLQPRSAQNLAGASGNFSAREMVARFHANRARRYQTRVLGSRVTDRYFIFEDSRAAHIFLVLE